MRRNVLTAVCIVLFCLFMPAVLGDTGDVGLAARAHASEDGSVSFLEWAALGLVALVLIAGFYNAMAESPPDHFLGYLRALQEGQVATKLFLRFEVEYGGKTKTAYLRTLSLKRAVLMTTAGDLPHAGARLTLHLASLAGFPPGAEAQVATVRRVRRAGNGQGWKVVELRFEPRQPTLLQEYLVHLTSGQIPRGGRPAISQR